jgi:uncharacterized membrane protein YbhN (UPF0104 family)
MRSALASRSTLLRILGTVFALALMVYLLGQQGWQEISEAIRGIQLSRFLTALLLMFASRFFVLSRWHVLLKSAKVDISLAQSARITFAGLFSNNFLPSTVGGDLARLGGALQLGFDGVISAASLVADRIIGVAGMFLVLPIGLQKLFLANTALQSSNSFFLMVFSNDSWFGKMWKRGKKITHRILGALKLWLKEPKSLVASLAFTLLHMTSLFSAINILLAGMGEELPFFQVAGLWSLVYVITLLPFTINALGLQEISISYAFTQLGGVGAANSLVLALLVRTLFLITSLPGALFLSDILPGIAKARPMMKRFDD